MRWLLVAALPLIGCAQTHPVPTQAMARTAIELHVAQQQGARYSSESAEACQRAEDALEQARRLVFRGQPEAALAAAEAGYAHARRARELSAETPAASARQLRTVTHALGGSASKVALTAPAVR